jgi:hypothetical protein
MCTVARCPQYAQHVTATRINGWAEPQLYRFAHCRKIQAGGLRRDAAAARQVVRRVSSATAAAAGCATANGRCFSRCARRRSRSGVQSWLSAAHRRGLVVIEGFPVRDRFDPDRRGQHTALRAIDGRACELLLEVLDSLEAGIRVRRRGNGRAASTIDCAAPHRGRDPHRLSVPARLHPRCLIEHYLVTSVAAVRRCPEQDRQTGHRSGMLPQETETT